MPAVTYTKDEERKLNFRLPTAKEVDEMVKDLEVTMASNTAYTGTSGCNCSLNGGNGGACNP